MRLVVLSDTHFGDDTSRISTTAGLNKPVFDRIAAAAGQSDYLILLGDIFDFSISDYAKAYQAAAPFFRAVRETGIAREVIYIPGNHDFSIWNIVMHQANVINRVARGEQPKGRPAVAAVLDARANADPEVVLGGVDPKRDRKAGEPKYGGLFLDYLSGTHERESLTFNVAFPNLYLIEPDGETTLFTHGHYFDPFWAGTLPVARGILKAHLELAGGPEPNIKDIVTVNFPLNELASSGLGQAGPLTDNVRAIQVDAKEGRLRRIETYANRARDMADRSLTFGGLLGGLKETVSDKFLDGARDAVLKIARNAKDVKGARQNATWLREPAVRRNLRTYLRACILEAGAIERQIGGAIPPVTKLVFGHTHVPTPVDLGVPVGERGDWIGYRMAGAEIRAFNTGGWLQSHGDASAGMPIGGLILTFDSGEREWWRSETV